MALIDRDRERVLTSFDSEAKQRAADRREMRDSDAIALRTSSDVDDILRAR